MHQFADAGTIFSVRSASLSILFILSRTEYATDALGGAGRRPHRMVGTLR